ncbi:MAG: DUF3786 domain-containing protein [Clostridia bacterium]|nr:DUF3786 domain-containing protein [Clostridia bacterium]
MERRNNYEIARQEACKLFAQKDIDQIIKENNLKSDDNYIYITYICREFKIDKKTGELTYLDGSNAGFGPTFSIFDFLCHKGTKFLAGTYGRINSLNEMVATSGVGTDFFAKDADYFDKHQNELRKACLEVGATEISEADMAFKFPIYKNFNLILRFYESDEDFPASIVFMWDLNTLEFINYETAYYVQGDVVDFIYSTLNKSM